MKAIERACQAVAGLAALTLLLLAAQFTWQYWACGLDTGGAQDATQAAQSTAMPSQAGATAASTGPSTGTAWQSGTPPDEPQYADGGIIGTISSPTLGAWQRSISEGTSLRILARYGAGHYTGTAQPGQPGTMALAGHATASDFAPISRLKPGNHVLIHTLTGRWYEYRVTGSEIVPDTQTTVIDPRPGAERGMTLTTCWPMTPDATNPTQRYVVYGTLEGWAEGDTRPGMGDPKPTGAGTLLSDTVTAVAASQSQRTGLKPTLALGLSLLVPWAALDGMAWLAGRRKACARPAHEPTLNALTLLWRLQAGPLFARIPLMLLLLAGAACILWGTACPWLAAHTSLLAAPTPVV